MDDVNVIASIYVCMVCTPISKDFAPAIENANVIIGCLLHTLFEMQNYVANHCTCIKHIWSSVFNDSCKNFGNRYGQVSGPHGQLMKGIKIGEALSSRDKNSI